MPRGVKKERKDPAARPALDRGIPAKVIDAILDVITVDEDDITMDAKICDDLGADSLDVVELAMLLEASCGVEITDEQIEGWEHGTVQDVLGTLKRVGARL